MKSMPKKLCWRLLGNCKIIDIDKELTELKGNPVCPRCKSIDIGKAGFTKLRRQRYKCKDCGKWFMMPSKKYSIKPRCHPDRKYHARGLCKECYKKQLGIERYKNRKVRTCLGCKKEKTIANNKYTLCDHCNYKRLRSLKPDLYINSKREKNRRRERSEKMKQLRREYAKKHREKTKKDPVLFRKKQEQSRQYYLKNKDEIIKRSKESQKKRQIENNREKFLLYEKEMRHIVYAI